MATAAVILIASGIFFHLAAALLEAAMRIQKNFNLGEVGIFLVILFLAVQPWAVIVALATLPPADKQA